MALLAGVLLGGLDLDRLIRVRERSEQRGNRFPRLEVDGAFLDLDDDVRLELPVVADEVVDAGTGPVGLRVVPLEVIVVDEAAVEDHPVVWRKGAGEHVRGIGWGAAVLRGAFSALGVRLDCEAAKVGHKGVDFFDLGLPPGDHGGVKGVEGWQTADCLWTGEIDRQREFDAPGAEDFGHPGELAEVLGGEQVEVGVDVVRVTAVDADGGEQARIPTRAGEVGADVAIFEKDRGAGVAALDSAVHVIPLVGPPNGRGRGLGLIGWDGSVRGDFFEEMEDAVELGFGGVAFDQEVCTATAVVETNTIALA